MPEIRYRAAVITVSDRGSRGEREDLSGPEIARILESIGIEIVARRIIPDEKEIIRQTLVEFCAEMKSICS